MFHPSESDITDGEIAHINSKPYRGKCQFVDCTGLKEKKKNRIRSIIDEIGKRSRRVGIWNLWVLMKMNKN